MAQVRTSFLFPPESSIFSPGNEPLSHQTFDIVVNIPTNNPHSFANPEERKKGTQENSIAIGLQNNEATVRWLYDQHFAAVAGDTVAFEGDYPPTTRKRSWIRRRSTANVFSSSMATTAGNRLLFTRMAVGPMGHPDRRNVGSGDTIQNL